MNLDIQAGQIQLRKGFEERLQRKLKFALSRMSAGISSISVILSEVDGELDQNKRKNVRAKRCCLKIYSDKYPVATYEDTQVELYRAIDRAIHKASRAMARRHFLHGITAAT